MKKILFALTVLLIVSIMTGEALGQTTINDGTLYYKITNTTKKTVEVVFNENYLNMTSVTIPSSVTYKNEKYSVSTIGKKAFYKSKSLIEVSIPKTIITVGDSAFAECNNLNQVIFNGVSSLKEIGVQAFGDCSSLENLNIPSSVTSLKNKSFYRCINLKNVQFDTPSSLTAIGPQTFRRCYSLEKISLPLSITQINTLAFANCVKLKEITGIQNVKTINSYAFYGCYYLETISNLEKLETLGENAFRQCARLRELHIPSTLTSIGNLAFSGNTTIICDDNSYVKKWISNANNCPYFTLFAKNLNDVAETDSRNVDFFCNTGWTQGNNDDEDFMLTAVPTLDNNYPHGMKRLGCWATALSQILYNLQVVPTGKVSYTYKTVNLQSDVDFGAEKIDFSKIVNEIDATSTDDEKRMTSLYSWYCLAALGNKGDEYSSDYYTRMLEKYYPVTTSEIFYPSTNNKNDVETFICNQLQNKRLIMVYRDGVPSSSEQPNGHAFVLDGIRFVDDIPYVHFNFGWAHNNDGWYDLWANSWTTSQVDLDGEKIYLMGIEKKPEINNQISSLNIVIPNKVDYANGEAFDKTGLKVFANYSDGTKKEVTDYELTGFNSKTNGEKYVTVNYDGLSARFKVFVGQSYPSYRRHINLEQEMSGGSLPSKVDLTQYLPPVKSQWWLYDDNGNQLSYNGKLGTCLAWAFGYYNRTYLRAKNLNLSKTDLEKPENQFSPKDLYMVISAGQKTWSQGLNGTETMEMLSTRGIASMKTVPYRNFEDSVYLRDNEIIETEAAEYKITSYDQIVSGFTKNAIKSALTKGHLIVFSANIGTDFKKGYGNKDSSHAMPYANYDFTSTGRHVMTICGYDDSKGEHGAFKVVNSYGPNWCEDGFIWIDQDFFTDNYAITDSQGNALGFCNYYAYIMHANDRVVSSLTVKNDITTYYVDDEFNKSGLIVTANYSDGSSATVSDYELSGFDSKTTGTKTITVSYKGKSTTFQITVKENNTNLHSITYIVDGEIHMQLKNAVVHGSRMILTTDPEKEGYTFDGWFTEDGSKYDFSTSIVNDDVTLYAHWSALEYTISYNLDGGVLSKSNPKKYTAENNDIVLNNPTKDGYEFLGWTGTGIAGCAKQVVIEKGSTGNREYTAEWEETTVAGDYTIHSIIFVDAEASDAYEHGRAVTMDRLTAFVTDISKRIGYRNNMRVHTSNEFNVSTAISELENLNVKPNDIVIFYYHGHGSNREMSNWPTMALAHDAADKSRLDHIFVKNELRKRCQNAKLVLCVADCCNSYSWQSDAQTDWTDNDADDNIKTLFTGFSGQKFIMLSASHPGQFGYSNKNIGSYLSFCLKQTIDDCSQTNNPTWENVLKETQSRVVSNLSSYDTEPQYEITDISDTEPVCISGRVLDSESNPLEGAYVSTSTEFSESNLTEENGFVTNNQGGYVYSGRYILTPFSPSKTYLTKVEILTWRVKNPGILHVGIFDSDWNLVWEKVLEQNDVVNRNWTSINIEGGLKVITGEQYYVGLWADMCSYNDEYYAYYYNGSKELQYRIWSNDDYFAKTNANGNYTYPVATNWSGTLNALYTGKKFNKLTFSYVVENVSGKNFVENGENIVVTNNVEYITVTAPTKTNYYIGEPFDESGLKVTAYFEDGTSRRVTDYTLDGFDSETTGKKTITVSYGGKSETVDVTVGYRKHTVTYIVDGEIHMQLKNAVVHGSRMILTNDPEKEGYTFDGWYTADGERYNFATGIVNDDVTLYAHWNIVEYTITYNLDGGVNSSDNPSIYTIEDGITLSAPTKEGFEFVGWSNNGKIEEGSTGDKTFTATWKKATYKITYFVDNVEYKVFENVIVGSTIGFIDIPTKTGYTFNGWNCDYNTMPNKDIEIKGSFAPNKHSVTYYVNNEVYETETYYYGHKIYSVSTPYKFEHTFSGWDKEIPETMPDEDLIISGTLSANKYSITYRIDNEYYKTVEVEYDSDITLIEMPSKEGYTFSGWQCSYETMPFWNITIDGSFEANNHTITCIVNGMVYQTYTYKYGETINISDPYESNYTFSGWDKTLPGTMPDENLWIRGTLTANQYKITYVVDGNEYETYYAEYGSVINLKTPLANNKTFKGWVCSYATMPNHDIVVNGWNATKITIVKIPGIIDNGGRYSFVNNGKGKVKIEYSNGDTDEDYFSDNMVTYYNGNTITVNYYGLEDTQIITRQENPIVDANIKIWSFGKTIFVKNAKSEINVIDMSGRRIIEVKPESSYIEIPISSRSGIYIVKTLGATKKVFIE